MYSAMKTSLYSRTSGDNVVSSISADGLTLRMTKWPGESAMLRGMSPGGPTLSVFLTETASNSRGLFRRLLHPLPNRLCLAWLALIHVSNLRRKGQLPFVQPVRTNHPRP